MIELFTAIVLVIVLIVVFMSFLVLFDFLSH